MTLIIGIKCQDGIVVAADGQATYATALGQAHTIQQPVSKLSIIGESVVLAVTGPVSLSQSFCLEIETELSKTNHKPHWKDSLKARDYLQTAMWKHAKPVWERAEVVAKTVGAGVALQAALHGSVVAFPLEDSPCLVQFNHQCDPENATSDLPFIAIGSGQTMADPFLAFIRRVFWTKSSPSVDEAIWAAYWTLDYSIKASPATIGYPIHIATLRKETTGGITSWKARELDDVGEHGQMVNEIEQKLSEIARITPTTQEPNPIP